MPEQQIDIRLATNADAETIAVLSRDTFYETFAPFNTDKNMEIFLTQQFTYKTLVDEVRFPSNQFFLAYAGDAVVGYIKLRDGEKPKELLAMQALEIARLYVKKEMIGRGVGRRLMQHAHDIAQEKKKQVIWLAVWENNKRAFTFYSSWGFEKFGSQIFVLGNELQKDWLMKKQLTIPPLH